jgi:N-acetylglucosamine kinase-like BadF-type ATPase
MAYFVGIDGGGTRTTAWLADERKRILSRAVTGPANPLKVGCEASEREILGAAHQALRKARLKKSQLLKAIAVGLAGVDRPQMHRPLFAWLQQAIPARHHLLTSDAAIALRAAIGDSPGVIVISGTGSISFARDERGRVLRSGGWGAPLDDAGSGYDLGRKAIIAALRHYDGRGPYTQLTRRICLALKIPDITRVILQPLTPHDIAALFPLVLAAARRRDLVARRLCEEAGKDLADLAVALLKRLGWQRRIVPVVTSGGVFQASLRIRQAFRRYLRRHAPQARVLLLRHPPVEGALALARDLVDPERRDSLVELGRSGP